ncbi:structural protein [Xanthomonas phage NEB7]|nr:structural protein [Xanthomonas phage NEB7]
MTDYLRTVMKQYANSPIISGLLASFDEWCDLSRFTADFLYNLWDISTATGYGLDVWGRILGQDRYLQIQQVPGNNFGFNINDAVGTQWQPFNQAPFFNGAAGGTTAFALEDVYYRKLLLVKAASNIASCDCPSINALMRAMFGDRGKCYVGYDPNQPMIIGYHFEFFPTAVERSIIESGLFPQPAGTTVRFLYKNLTYAPFGFAGANTGANPEYVTGFNQGPFYNNP